MEEDEEGFSVVKNRSKLTVCLRKPYLGNFVFFFLQIFIKDA